jgi:hypothetical protein
MQVPRLRAFGNKKGNREQGIMNQGVKLPGK